MHKSCRIIIWSLLMIGGLFLLVFMAPQGSATVVSKVAVIPIHGAIDPGMKNFVERSMQEAVEADADALILDINTPGGYVAAAKDIRDLMDRFPGPVYAFVNPWAISAGAYLALAADEIYMVSGSAIGAAEPSLLGTGDVDEKSLSVWESDMRTLAQRRERDPKIAAAMVRKEVAIPEVVEQGKLLTLTATEALDVGYSEGTVADLSGLLQQLGLSGAEVLDFSPTSFDSFIGWVTNPVIGVILLVIGIGGMALEIFTAGFGAAGILSLMAFTLYFGGNIAAGTAEYWVVLLFVLGVVMMLVEAFIPGFGIFGVAGLAATITSIVLAASTVEIGLMMLAVSLVVAGVLSTLTFRYFSKRGALRHIFLSDEERPELGYVAHLDRKNLLGLEGKAVTTLRPAGTVELAGQRIDAVSEGGFVSQGAPVKVVYVEGMRVVVRPLEPPDIEAAEKKTQDS